MHRCGVIRPAQGIALDQSGNIWHAHNDFVDMHSQPKDYKMNKTNWKDYALEFLSIFIAAVAAFALETYGSETLKGLTDLQEPGTSKPLQSLT